MTTKRSMLFSLFFAVILLGSTGFAQTSAQAQKGVATTTPDKQPDTTLKTENHTKPRSDLYQAIFSLCMRSTKDSGEDMLVRLYDCHLTAVGITELAAAPLPAPKTSEPYHGSR